MTVLHMSQPVCRRSSTMVLSGFWFRTTVRNAGEGPARTGPGMPFCPGHEIARSDMGIVAVVLRGSDENPGDWPQPTGSTSLIAGLRGEPSIKTAPGLYSANLPGRDASHRTCNQDTHLTHGCMQHFRQFSRVRFECAVRIDEKNPGFAKKFESALRTLAEPYR